MLVALALAGCAAAPGERAVDGGTRDAAPPFDGANGRDADAGVGSPDACVSPIAPDPHAGERAACTFTMGASVQDTLAIDPATRAAIPIDHIVVLMKENRSFDQILGALHDEGQPEAEAVPAGFENDDLSGDPVARFHQTTTCYPRDPGHQWDDMHAQADGGAMDGFVTRAAQTAGGDGHFVMGYYDQDDLPFYYWLASTYALNDHHFASLLSGTYPNRDFLMLGTADGVRSTGNDFPSPSTPTIFQALDAVGVSWGVYSDGALLSGSLNWTLDTPGTHPFVDFLTGLDDGTLPQVAFVDGIDDLEDEHPAANVQQGEAWTRNVYEHAIHSPLWPGLAVIWTYDEAGGFADHVPPGLGCVARPGPTDEDFFELGMRVPFLVISPWARPHYVSHVVQEHTAITRFIETVFDLPALTARDANSSALLDLFEFGCAPPLMSPPPAPEAGVHGCFGACRIATSQESYHQGDPIPVSFTDCPGNNPIDWIGVYPYAAGTPELPHRGSTLWEYIGGTHAGTTMPATGSVTLDESSQGRGPWPLPAGSYTAYYLLDDGYILVDSVPFTVTP